MKTKGTMLALVAAGGLVVAGNWSAVAAQDNSTSQKSGTNSGSMKKGHDASMKHKEGMGDHSMMTSSMDKKFVMEAAMGGMAEVEMGRLATEKASSSDVKSFGQRMVDDHTKANDELKALANQKGIMVPAELSPKDKAMKDQLSKLSGDAFDRAYMKMMVKDHTKDVADFQKASSKGMDADVKGFASKTLPTLQEHLQMARDVNGKVSGGKKMASNSKM